MSVETRQALVDSPNLIFQNESQRSDLLDPNKTQTYLVAFLGELLDKGHIIELTAVKSDHSDDSALGEHCHFNGWCVDCWPLASQEAGDYLDASDEEFADFLSDAAEAQYHHQTGLAGTAYTSSNMTAAGPTAFQDDGADHVHLGTQAA